MPKQYRRSLFIFHRDLRLQDNTALLAALAASEEVLLSFIFDTRQIDSRQNTYYSQPAVQFMVESLEDLEKQIAKKKHGTLYYFSGITHDVVETLLTHQMIEAVYSNYDYTPFAKLRDEAVLQVCTDYGVPCHQYHDALLHPPGSVRKADGTPYTVYTPFAKKAKLAFSVPTSIRNTYTNYFSGDLSQYTVPHNYLYTLLPTPKLPLRIRGGRTQAKKILNDISTYKAYRDERNKLDLDATTHLSAHHKFGTVSVREVYATIKTAFGAGHQLISELYWRDFFTHIAYHFPHVFAGNFHSKYDAVPWETNPDFFAAWCEGRTGFPIVDAGMRELNETGYMHNRARMIVASFLTKDLHIDWRLGEQYFASRLVDYDPAVNNGNWQWAASTGCDAQPYFRVFNPWLQQKKFDTKAQYIKRWVPELHHVPVQDIMHWYNMHTKHTDTAYPGPIVDHAVERNIAITRFAKVASSNN